MASTYLTQTTSSSTGKIFTFSGWIKKSANDSINQILHMSSDSNVNNYIEIATKSANGLDIQMKNGSGGTFLRRQVTRKLRDFSGWYHICVRFDSTQGTAADRWRIYINGTQATDINTDGTPDVPLDYVTEFYNASTLNIGANIGGSSNFFDGLMSYVILCDGYSYGPDSFGETDATSGEWKIKTSPSVTYGTNGFFILKDGNGITDQSGEGNDFTLGGGTLTDLQDCPSDVFATMATVTWFDGTVANCGNTITTNSSERWYQGTSLGVNKGKFYWEVKISTLDEYALLGITSDISPSNTTSSDWILGSGKYDYAVYTGDGTTGGGNGHTYNNAGAAPGNTPGQFMGAISQGDILTFALDCDNNNLKIGANGLWANGSNATDQTFGNAATKSIWSIAEMDSNAVKGTGFYFAGGGDYGGTNVYQFNFGNGYFGTDAIASEGTNASGIGKFEYDVPTGYTALSTKGLQE